MAAKTVYALEYTTWRRHAALRWQLKRYLSLMNNATSPLPVLLRAYVPRSNSAIGVTLGATITAICIFALWRLLSAPLRPPIVLTAFVGLIGVAMLWLTAYFAASIVRPPLILEATPQGILTYLDLKSHRYVDTAQLLPWQKILHIDYYSTVDAIMPEGSRGRFHVETARLQLKPGHGLPIDGLSILKPLSFPTSDAGDNTGIDWGNTIFLNATTSFGSAESLCQALEDLRRDATGLM